MLSTSACYLLTYLLVSLPGGLQSVSVDSSTTSDSDTTGTAAAGVHYDTHHSSSSSSSSSSDSVVTPGLVSAVCSLLSNLLALAPHDVSTALRSHAVLQALMK